MPTATKRKKRPAKIAKNVLYVNGVPLDIRQRIAASAKVRSLSIAAYIVKLVQLHSAMLDLATDTTTQTHGKAAESILADAGLGPVQR